MRKAKLYAFALAGIIMAASVQASQEVEPRLTPTASDLMAALDVSDVAEIYVVRRELEFPMALQPVFVRSSGCRYRVFRESPQWRDFERAMTDARVEFVPTSARGDLRIGLILSDARGMVREIYSSDLARPDGRVTGIDQRRQIEISPSFIAAVQRFVAQHPDLAMTEEGDGIRLCPRRAP